MLKAKAYTYTDDGGNLVFTKAVDIAGEQPGPVPGSAPGPAFGPKKNFTLTPDPARIIYAGGTEDGASSKFFQVQPGGNGLLLCTLNHADGRLDYEPVDSSAKSIEEMVSDGWAFMGSVHLIKEDQAYLEAALKLSKEGGSRAGRAGRAGKFYQPPWAAEQAPDQKDLMEPGALDVSLPGNAHLPLAKEIAQFVAGVISVPDEAQLESAIATVLSRYTGRA